MLKLEKTKLSYRWKGCVCEWGHNPGEGESLEPTQSSNDQLTTGKIYYSQWARAAFLQRNSTDRMKVEQLPLGNQTIPQTYILVKKETFRKKNIGMEHFSSVVTFMPPI